MRTLRRLVPLFVSALLLGGAAPAQPDSAEPAPLQELAQAELNAAVITLVDPGAEPRQLLRYDFANMQPTTLAMDTSMSMSMSMAFGSVTQTLPTIRAVTSIRSITPTGSGALIETRLDRFELIPRPGTDPMMEQVLQQTLAGFAGAVGTVEMDAAGRVLSATFDTSGLDPMVAQQVESITQSLQQAAVPLPDVPVGAGARWEAAVDMVAGGMSVSQRTQFRLDEVTPTGAQLSVSVSQTAATQTFSDPATGMAMTLESMSATGTGTSSLQLSSVIPTGAMHVEVSMAMTSADPAMAAMGTMSMTMSMDTSVAPY